MAGLGLRLERHFGLRLAPFAFGFSARFLRAGFSAVESSTAVSVTVTDPGSRFDAQRDGGGSAFGAPGSVRTLAGVAALACWRDRLAVSGSGLAGSTEAQEGPVCRRRLAGG